MRRMLARQTLDALPDFSVGASGVSFNQSLMEIESDETFFAAPKTLVDACRSILTLDINTTVDRVVHDSVTVQIRCDHVPPFALVNGGRDRTISPPMRLRRLTCFSGYQKICLRRKLKRVIVGVAHSHDFSSFQSRSQQIRFTRRQLSSSVLWVHKTSRVWRSK